MTTLTKNMSYNKSWIPLNKIDHFAFLTLLLVTLLISSGCSVTPWQQTSLSLNEQDEYQQIIHHIDAQEQQCSPGFDAEALVTLSNSVQNKSISGYLAVLAPGKIKFVVSTPFGQPLYIATTQTNTYQFINVAERNYRKGQLLQLTNTFELPQILSKIDSALLLSGMLSKKRPEHPTIYKDRQGRGFWVSWRSGDFTLIEPTHSRVLARRIAAEDDETLEIGYGKWQENGTCARPTNITLSGLSYNTEITIHLSKIQNQPLFNKKQFTVQVPNNFTLLPE